jgi:hypothetical protein
MLVSELVRNAPFNLTLSPYSPFVYFGKVKYWEYYATFLSTLGFTDDSTQVRLNIKQITRDYLNKYILMTSVATCQAQEGSFYFDHANQIIYIHMEHDYSPYSCVLEYGYAFGLSKGELVYINDYEYLPLIDSIPSIEQSADILNSGEITLVSGSMVCNNEAVPNAETVKPEGPLDFLIDESVYGNDLFIYNYDLDSEVLTPLSSLYVEDYSFTLKQLSFDLQDKRKKQNIKVPVATFTEDDYPDVEDSIIDSIIPIIYGPVNEAKAICTNGTTTSGVVNFRIALELTSLGFVYVKIDDVWTRVNPTSVNLATGEFVLSSASGRNSSGGVYECKAVELNKYIPRIEEVNNPIIAGAQETSRVMIGDTCHVFYSQGGGALYHAIATDALCRELTNIVATNVSACRFPYVFYNPADGYFYLITHIVDQGPMYMYNSIDGIAWGFLNFNDDGIFQPVFTCGSGIYAYAWNPAVELAADGDTMRFVIECGTQSDQTDVGLGYSTASLAALAAGTCSFNTNRTSAAIIPGGGNPFLINVPDRSAIVCICGSLNYGYWRIRAYYALLSSDLALASSWTESPYFDISYEGMATADPDFVVLSTSKTYALLIGYMYNQSSSYQAYYDMTLNELYDFLVDGIIVTPFDIIKDLNDKYLGVKYLDPNYDITEWEAEEVSNLVSGSIGFEITKQIELFSIIYDISTKSKGIFRYEFTTEGKITIRVRDTARASSGYIPSCDIKNIDEIPIETDSEDVYSSIKVNYAHNYVEDSDSSLVNNNYYNSVVSKYRELSELEEDTYLPDLAAATIRAAADALEYSEIPHIVTLELFGSSSYLSIKIFEVWTIALKPDDQDSVSRDYFGVKKCLILSINPDADAGTNSITALIVGNAVTP